MRLDNQISKKKLFFIFRTLDLLDELDLLHKRKDFGRKKIGSKRGRRYSRDIGSGMNTESQRDISSSVDTESQKRSLELREALDNIAIADRDLRQWELIDTEWDLLKQIKKLLYIFLRATLHISHG
ncbi:unnamed protein product [Rhizophagus irregularis]|nr:unnamed protein product [Rhizophagus irregularis]